MRHLIGAERHDTSSSGKTLEPIEGRNNNNRWSYILYDSLLEPSSLGLSLDLCLLSGSYLRHPVGSRVYAMGNDVSKTTTRKSRGGNRRSSSQKAARNSSELLRPLELFRHVLRLANQISRLAHGYPTDTNDSSARLTLPSLLKIVSSTHTVVRFVTTLTQSPAI
jgi:hypothetical protein